MLARKMVRWFAAGVDVFARFGFVSRFANFHCGNRDSGNNPIDIGHRYPRESGGFRRSIAVALVALPCLCSATASAQSRGRSRLPLIAPSASWNGTISWVGRNPPQDPERTSFKPVAHFAIPPFQDVTADLTVPVVAFAKGGIERVRFDVEGRTVDLRSPTIVSEFEGDPFEAFAVKLDVSKFPRFNGPIDVYASVFPADPMGQPRVIRLPLFANIGGGLPSMAVHVDANRGSDSGGNGSEANPYQTIGQARNALRGSGFVSGGQIILHDGDYTVSDGVSGNVVNDRWLTIRSARGSKPRIVGSGKQFTGLRVRRIKYQGISFVHLSGNNQIVTDSQFPDSSVWIDQSTYVGPGRTNPAYRSSRLTLGFDYNYFTDVASSSSRDGLIAAALSRNVSVTDISADALSLSSAVIGAHVDVVDSSGTKNHPDLWQFTVGDHENKLLYGVTTTANTQAQGVFLDDFTTPARDIAIVSNLIQTGTYFSQINDVQVHHLVIAGNTFADGFLIRDNKSAGLMLSDVEMIGNVFAQISSTVRSLTHGRNGNRWDRNFFVDPSSAHGTNVRTGEPDWNAAFVPRAGGNLRMNRKRFVILDAHGEQRHLRSAYFGGVAAR